ncbi:MAG TPA: aldo/keto reductase, partial [Candidatus Sumerlaeota bacterium]|nr:aldo/keto reductase [Candidatus Sumerlaeota bacterium]
GYCMGCENICGRTLDGKVPVADVMRYMMYHRSYGDTALARMHFAELPRDIRGMLSRLDYSAAERACPQHLAIGEIMKEAVRVLG